MSAELGFHPPYRAVLRALDQVGRGTYGLGHGGSDPERPAPFDSDGECDCSGFVCWALGVPRHPAKELWFYTDSMLRDGLDIHQPYFDLVPDDRVRPGDVLVWRGIDLDGDGRRERVGHCSLVVKVWRPPLGGTYRNLDVVQCQAATKPAVVRTSGRLWEGRDRFRNRRRVEWASAVVRPNPLLVTP